MSVAITYSCAKGVRKKAVLNFQSVSLTSPFFHHICATPPFWQWQVDDQHYNGCGHSMEGLVMMIMIVIDANDDDDEDDFFWVLEGSFSGGFWGVLADFSHTVYISPFQI